MFPSRELVLCENVPLLLFPPPRPRTWYPTAAPAGFLCELGVLKLLLKPWVHPTEELGRVMETDMGDEGLPTLTPPTLMSTGAL